MTEDSSSTDMATFGIVGIVAVVAVVGLVGLFQNSGSSTAVVPAQSTTGNAVQSQAQGVPTGEELPELPQYAKDELSKCNNAENVNSCVKETLQELESENTAGQAYFTYASDYGKCMTVHNDIGTCGLQEGGVIQ